MQAGIIVHGDEQVIPIEDHLEALVEKHIPKDKRDGFFFHATDIYGGGDKKCIFHDKMEWPDERRWAILDDLVAVPAMFDLPICIGVVEKDKFPELERRPLHTAAEIVVAQHAMAIIQCEMAVEIWLREKTKKEIAHIIAENNDEVRLAAREAHVLLRNKEEMEREGFVNHACFPFKRIRDGLQFTTKAESKLLQVADACAWTIRRAGNKSPDAGRFYVPLMHKIIRYEIETGALEAQPS